MKKNTNLLKHIYKYSRFFMGIFFVFIFWIFTNFVHWDIMNDLFEKSKTEWTIVDLWNNANSVWKKLIDWQYVVDIKMQFQKSCTDENTWEWISLPSDSDYLRDQCKQKNWKLVPVKKCMIYTSFYSCETNSDNNQKTCLWTQPTILKKNIIIQENFDEKREKNCLSGDISGDNKKIEKKIVNWNKCFDDDGELIHISMSNSDICKNLWWNL